MNAQVLTIDHVRLVRKLCPALSSLPAMCSESTRFLGQPRLTILYFIEETPFPAWGVPLPVQPAAHAHHVTEKEVIL